MNLDALKQYFMKLYGSSPAGMINSATGAGAQAAGVPSGASPLSDSVRNAGSEMADKVNSAIPQPIQTGIDKTNSFLDMLHNKLFGSW